MAIGSNRDREGEPELTKKRERRVASLQALKVAVMEQSTGIATTHPFAT